MHMPMREAIEQVRTDVQQGAPTAITIMKILDILAWWDAGAFEEHPSPQRAFLTYITLCDILHRQRRENEGAPEEIIQGETTDL